MNWTILMIKSMLMNKKWRRVKKIEWFCKKYVILGYTSLNRKVRLNKT